MYPIARTNELVTEELASETIVYDTKRHRAHCLNRTAGLIWRSCDGRTSVQDIARRVSDATGLPENEDIVRLGLRELNARGLLADRLAPPDVPRRRELLSRLAAAGATAIGLLPAISSIVAPTPATAAKSGDTDGKDKDKDKEKDKVKT